MFFWSLLLILLPSNVSSKLDYFLLDAGDERGPRCIDGSPASYFLRLGLDHKDGSKQRQWIINFEGGGWCWDVEMCLYRAATKLGSSNKENMTRSVPTLGYSSNNPKENRQFYDWNHVFVSYCDGSSFAGDQRIEYKVLVRCFLPLLSPHPSLKVLCCNIFNFYSLLCRDYCFV